MRNMEFKMSFLRISFNCCVMIYLVSVNIFHLFVDSHKLLGNIDYKPPIIMDVGFLLNLSHNY
jgi:hypothetical protein